MKVQEFCPSEAEHCESLLIDTRGSLDSQSLSIASAITFIRKCGIALQTLSIYGAIGIVSFGWTLSRLLHFECIRYVPLWFFSALFIYNLDRLKKDPADLINTPARSQSAANFRKISRALTLISAAALVVVPILEKDWLMLLLTTGGAVVCMNYSVPMFGVRFKDIPFLKSFFAPTLVTAAFIVPPLLQQPLGADHACYAIVTAWTWCVTLFNMLLCDLRDIEGDANTGVRSLPVAIGGRRTIFTLCTLLVLGVVLSITMRFECDAAGVIPWIFLSIILPVYLAGLLAAIRKPMPEDFYEWWVEGILLVPAIIYSVTS
jgi:4-hydroxybenzoate polyprenyltransferase